MDLAVEFLVDQGIVREVRFPGNHVLHVSQPDYLRRMTRFLGEFMFD